MQLRQYKLVRIRQLLHSPEEYDGWRINQRPPRVGDIGTIVDIIHVPGLPVDYVVEACMSDGTTLWLSDFLEEELAPVED